MGRFTLPYLNKAHHRKARIAQGLPKRFRYISNEKQHFPLISIELNMLFLHGNQIEENSP